MTSVVKSPSASACSLRVAKEREEEIMDLLYKIATKVLGGYIVICTILIILLKAVFMLSLIPSASMEGTIMTGDVVISTRYDIGKDELQRYDILVFVPPDKPDMTYIKRVIGLPGETIEVKNGKVYADGVELDNSFLKMPQNRKGDGIYIVPEGCYFFLGDNRNHSNDSRFWDEKYVPLENIQAKARFILLPFDNIGSL